MRRALPAVWELITPAAALRAREAGAVAAIRAVARAGARRAGAGPVLGAAANLLAAAACDLDPAGRPLAAPNAALPVPDEPAGPAVARGDGAARASR